MSCRLTENVAMDGKRPTGRSNRFLRFFQRAGWFFSGMAVLGACLLFRSYAPADNAAAAPKPPAGKVKQASATEPAKTPSAAAPKGAENKKPQVVAVVNNEPIGREDLARECLLHYG